MNIDTLIGILVSILILGMIYGLSLTVDEMIAHKTCLEAGYPEVRTTWDYDNYCINLTGDVTVKVDKL